MADYKEKVRRVKTGAKNEVARQRKLSELASGRKRVATSTSPEQKRNLTTGALLGAGATASAGLGGSAVATGNKKARSVTRAAATRARKAGKPAPGKVTRVATRAGKTLKHVPKGKAAASLALGYATYKGGQRATTKGRAYRDWYT